MKKRDRKCKASQHKIKILEDKTEGTSSPISVWNADLRQQEAVDANNGETTNVLVQPYL